MIFTYLAALIDPKKGAVIGCLVFSSDTDSVPVNHAILARIVTNRIHANRAIYGIVKSSEFIWTHRYSEIRRFIREHEARLLQEKRLRDFKCERSSSLSSS